MCFYLLCSNCQEPHDLAACCDCGAAAFGKGRYAHLCPDHAAEAYSEEEAERKVS
jgi:hypothetical protein